MPRPLIAAAVLTAAIGGPYVASETDMGRGITDSLRSNLPSSSGGSSAEVSEYGQDVSTVGYANHAHHQVERLRPSDPAQYRYDERLASKLGAIPADPAASPRITGVEIDDLRQVLRFDISPDWVLSKFSRVTTILADTNLEALRVPIVTGIRADDLAGTLTYSFDRSGELQRLTLHGFTGDPSKIVQTMTEFYGLTRNPSLEAGVFTKSWNGSPVHFLRLSHAPVVYSNAIHQKYTVFLELNQPSLAYGISAEAKRVIYSDRGADRW